MDREAGVEHELQPLGRRAVWIGIGVVVAVWGWANARLERIRSHAPQQQLVSS